MGLRPSRVVDPLSARMDALTLSYRIVKGEQTGERLLGNRTDESDNRKLSLVASTAAAPIWHERILSTCTCIGPFRFVDREEARALK